MYKIRWLILALSILVLTGCQRAPIIKISEENQQKISEKTATHDTDEKKSEDDVLPLEETPPMTPLDMDTSGWERLDSGQLELSVSDFLPNQANQLKEFTTEMGQQVTYVDFYDANLQWMQVENRLDAQKPSVMFYQWTTEALTAFEPTDVVNPYVNYLATVAQGNMTEGMKQEVLLTFPLAVNSQWERSEGVQSEITAIYAQANIHGENYTNVIEVTTTYDSLTRKEWWAQKEGLVGQSTYDQQGQLSSYWQLAGNYHEQRLVVKLAVSLPTEDDKIVSDTASFRWQTNMNMAIAMDSLLKEMGLIDDTITVNQLIVENGIAVLDFTPGVVAVINQHVASEETVINSIVKTLGDFMGVKQVRLTVEGMGLLPDTFPYPEGGIYQVESGS